MYGPVRTVVWQGSAGDRRPYADHRCMQSGLEALEKDGIGTRADNMGCDGANGKMNAYTIMALNFTLLRLKPRVWENLPYSTSVPMFLRLELLKTA